jgi:hypothetical protein
MHTTLAEYFWRGDFLGLAMIVIALLGIVALQVGLAMVVMFAMNKLIPDKLTETTYGDFDFDSFQKPAFQNFVVRLAVIFGGTTLLLHLLIYLIISREILKHWGLWTLLLLVLETAGIFLGLRLVFRLDNFRLAVITAASAIIYLLLFGLLRYSDLLVK